MKAMSFGVYTHEHTCTFEYAGAEKQTAKKFGFHHFCELLGSIILSACLAWGFVPFLAIIQVMHNHGKLIFFAVPK